ncbi:hypothetical protein BC828DRAFT_406607 [Blastocladiella britannica]|nr:hypothetical protein BC828DRAFT_406607 [Blastocladiella britannica]
MTEVDPILLLPPLRSGDEVHQLQSALHHHHRESVVTPNTAERHRLSFAPQLVMSTDNNVDEFPPDPKLQLQQRLLKLHSSSTSHSRPSTASYIERPPQFDPPGSAWRSDPLHFHNGPRVRSAIRIWRAWSRYRDRCIFQHLKELLLRSETTLTHTLLKKLSPLEAQLLRDPVNQSRVRFRFGGSLFPPQVHYKLYNGSSPALATTYLSGAVLLTPDSRGARDAWALMGNARYLHTAVGDDAAIARSAPGGISDPALVASPRDAVRFAAALDARSPMLGGRANGWRVLDGWPVTGLVAVWAGGHTGSVAAAARRLRHFRAAAARTLRDVVPGHIDAATHSQRVAGARWEATRGPVYSAMMDRHGSGGGHSPTPSVTSSLGTGGGGGKRLMSRAERERELRKRKIERLRQLYVFGDKDDVQESPPRSRQGSAMDRRHLGPADHDDEENDFGELFEWSVGLNIDDYSF